MSRKSDDPTRVQRQIQKQVRYQTRKEDQAAKWAVPCTYGRARGYVCLLPRDHVEPHNLTKRVARAS